VLPKRRTCAAPASTPAWPAPFRPAQIFSRDACSPSDPAVPFDSARADHAL
jgi:hypothetical protein